MGSSYRLLIINYWLLVESLYHNKNNRPEMKKPPANAGGFLLHNFQPLLHRKISTLQLQHAQI